MASIAECVAEVDRRLVGPRGARADMVAEIRDGLTDAADAYVQAGLSPDEAEQRAVADFGPPGPVAALLQDELALGAGRRAAWLTIVVLAVQPLVWRHVHPPATPATYDALRVLVESVGLAAMVAAAAWAVMCARVDRASAVGRRLARAGGLVAVGASLAIDGLGTALMVAGDGMTTASLARLVLGVVLPLGAVAVAGAACVRAGARRLSPAAPG